MKKPSPYTLLMWVAILVVIAGAILQLMHQISLGTMQFFFAFSFLLYFLARRLKPNTL